MATENRTERTRNAFFYRIKNEIEITKHEHYRNGGEIVKPEDVIIRVGLEQYAALRNSTAAREHIERLPDGGGIALMGHRVVKTSHYNTLKIVIDKKVTIG